MFISKNYCLNYCRIYFSSFSKRSTTSGAGVGTGASTVATLARFRAVARFAFFAAIPTFRLRTLLLVTYVLYRVVSLNNLWKRVYEIKSPRSDTNRDARQIPGMKSEGTTPLHGGNETNLTIEPTSMLWIAATPLLVSRT